MAGISDSGNPDDIHIHLEQILSADASRAEDVEGESELEKIARQSVRLSPTLRRRTSASLEALTAAVPGLSDVEAKKLLTTRAGRDALKKGQRALTRVDDHLQSVSGRRNPQIGRSYGVYGRNPETFGGVYRALGQCVTENERIKALATDAPDRARVFTPYVELLVTQAYEELKGILGARLSTRADLSQQVAVRDEVLKEAVAAISAVRCHLYANLPLGKRDPDLREYGFRPLRAGRPSASVDDAEEDETDEEEAA